MMKIEQAITKLYRRLQYRSEMKYLHDGIFGAIIMKDLGFDINTDYLCIKSFNETPLTIRIPSVSGSS
jgi:hypothetical protein